ncbi:hypothetical protein [Rufibacter quisquiliarum]|uniref:Uncharacterized protein n=1 Tax=Rufibacter quisquiliarum TaxID=1549639 RepID=A0A839GM26_9BACT|nr:hypothetical protein [Rufibacter quisquiliarum]MBA9076625.1 hypothetical protein [Rufibacter quisquiliarum]
MSVPTLPLPQKIKAYAASFLLVLLIYVVIDLYVPLKHLFVGEPLSFQEAFTYINLQSKWPIILIIGLLMGRNSVRKKERALQGAVPQTPAPPTSVQ